ncbi:acyl-CoA dehydrogenase NM domain-like protein [Multifurca ochricompacta]|uniref:Acyl-CoA dehydrogenase NM domain-like protein n=1 Tax=Multifurca ochricompacta TaxID=376703 RepID=A0AAD4QPB5_9AGAM|nr:acyl-CoA dehydrogenase NM domain-like protein [Multifurca ochricompacta]
MAKSNVSTKLLRGLYSVGRSDSSVRIVISFILSVPSFQDPLDMEDQLSEEEISIRDTARDFCREYLAPRVLELTEQRLDKSVLPAMGSVGLLGPTIQGYGCAGVNYVSYGLIAREIERHHRLGLPFNRFGAVFPVMHPINTFGTEAQKQKYLPALAKGELIGCFGLTEPNHGSDPAGMDTTAEETSGGFDIFIIWARCKWDGKVRGFILEKGLRGLSALKISNKLALRASTTGSIFMDNVKVSLDALMPGAIGLGAAFSCLNSARYGISWGVMGALESCLVQAQQYALERHQFKRPLASFQLVQKKLADAHTEIALGLQASLRVGRLKDAGRAVPEMISIVKRNNCGKALHHARVLLDILGGNAAADEYHIGRHAGNLQVTNTYEGTFDIHTLILGKAITGVQAFS